MRLYNKDASVDLSGASHNLSAEVATKRSRDVEVIVVYEHAKLGPDAWTWANFTVGRVRVTTPSRTFHIRFAQGAQVLVLKAVAPEFMGNENGWSVGFTTIPSDYPRDLSAPPLRRPDAAARDQTIVWSTSDQPSTTTGSFADIACPMLLPCRLTEYCSSHCSIGVHVDLPGEQREEDDSEIEQQ
jgi:hypothetical protein